MKTADTQEIMNKLKTALRTDGNFPERTQIVAQLRLLAQSPNATIQQVADVVLREPTLAVRVLHLVNTVFFQRQVTVMTVTQAVVQIGMKNLSELCANLVLLERFLDTAKRGPEFQQVIHETIFGSLLSSSLSQYCNEDIPRESAYLAATFSKIAILLIAHYFPEIFLSCWRDAEVQKISLQDAIAKRLAIPWTEVTQVIIDELGIPQYYRDMIGDTAPVKGNVGDKSAKIADVLRSSEQLAHAVCTAANRNSLDVLFNDTAVRFGTSVGAIENHIQDTLRSYEQHCRVLSLSTLARPPHLAETDEVAEVTQRSDGPTSTVELENSDFAQHVLEINDAIYRNAGIPAIITAVMETIAFSLDFDRVLLLLADPKRERLHGKMAIGKTSTVEPVGLVHEVCRNNAAMPDIAAFVESTPQIFGEPLYSQAWPFAAIPIGYHQQRIGVIYADRVDRKGIAKALDGQTQAALGVLSDLLESSITHSAKQAT